MSRARRLILPVALCAALAACATPRPIRSPEVRPPEKDSGDIPDGKPVFTFEPATTNAGRLAADATNIRVNQDSSGRDQNETTIALNPLNALNLVGGANDARLGRWTAAWYSSLDGGATWVDGPAPHQKYSNQGDPTLAFCGDGTVVFGYLDYNGASAPHRLLVTRSTDGGRTWLGPGIVQETNGFPFADKPYIACAPAGGSYPNRAYVSWTNFGTTSPIRVVFSTDRGQTWTGAKNVSGGYGVQGSIPVAAANGLVYVFWLGPSGIEFTKSTNGGGTWAAYRTVSSASSIPGTQFRRNSFPTAGIDRSGGAHAGNVYVAWSDNRNGDPDILFSRSTDAGNTWSAPLRVNDDALGNGRDQFFPWLAVDEKGNVHLMWHDRRDDPANDRIHVYIATSHDGGLSFDANLRVTDLPSRGSLTGFLGDYAALAAGAGKVFPFWSDLRAGTGEEDVFLEIEPAFDYDLVKNVRFAADRETLEFDDQEPRVGSAIVYDVLVGDVADLLGGAPWSLARCAGENVNAPPARVDEVPPPGTAVYVLVRAQGPRGVGSYGSGGAHPDAWDGFDEQGACD